MREPQTLFGKRLREVRLKADLSQKQLGLKIGLDVGVASARMNQYEVGSHSPKFSTAVRIANALNVPTSYFYEEIEQIAKFIVFSSKLSNSELDDLIQQIKEKSNSTD